MGSDLRKTFDGRTNDGTPLDRIPFMNGIKRLKDFDLIVLVSAGAPGAKEYVQFVGTRYKLRMVAACTAVSTTDLSPTSDRQLVGLVGGAGWLRRLRDPGRQGAGTVGADVLNVGNVVVISPSCSATSSSSPAAPTRRPVADDHVALHRRVRLRSGSS
jgi:hypothetical protein